MSKDRLDVQMVKERVDMVGLISRYVSLAKTGTSYKGRCPFHSDDTPSLVVNAQKGLWHCFGCGEGGDLFSFLMKIERISFPEALERLAEEAGVSLRRRDDGAKEPLREIIAEVAAYFADNLTNDPAGEKARKYLLGRGYKQEVWKQFCLGYAFPGWDRLKKKFGKRYKVETLVNLGLLVKREDRCYDRFRDRIIFPIHDLSGRPIAFGGRAFEGEPKYLNSSQNPLFDKGRQLYGLLWARKEISSCRTAILVEGYTDVISTSIAGIENVVGSMGTALTQRQADLLARFTDEVVIAYDRDAAGGAASLRGMRILRNSGLNVRVAELPIGEDPDSFVSREGAEGMLAVIGESTPFHHFFVRSLELRYDLSTVAGKEGALEESRAFYQGIVSLPLRQEITKLLAEGLQLPADELRQDLSRTRPHTRIVRETSEKGQGWNEEEVILCLLLRGEVSWSQVAELATPDDFSPDHKPIAEVFANAGEPSDPSNLIEELDE
ncbi:DNA primase, partial [Candidatus Bipolaricaulota bacterium]|nr:DNA primase [Candidatus Bipolaricaulota bacterium]